jgi:hypothetical protein
VNGTSPTSPQYNFGYVDSVLRKLTRSRLQPLLLITDAPLGPGGGSTASEYANGA